MTQTNERFREKSEAQLSATTLAKRKVCFDSVILRLKWNKWESFQPLPSIDALSPEQVRALSAEGNVFEPIVEGLRSAGFPIEMTIGDAMDLLGLDEMGVSEIGCENTARSISGERAATRISRIRNRQIRLQGQAS